jgi:hypothetical protein
MSIGIGIGITFGKSSTPNPVAQAPVNTSPPVISPEGNQVIGTVFTSGNGSWFATRPLTFEYRWTRNGTPISGATSQTYTSVSADEGQTLRCEVRATNAFGVSSYIASSNSSTGVSLPVNTVAPVISGSTTLGSVLSTTNGTWTGTSPITFSYQWKRGGVSIGGATSSTYTLVAADSSANITCEVTGTNVAGSVSANSNTITASNFNPVNTIAPTLSPSGTQSTGTVITLGNGTWSGASPITFEYRWLRDNSIILGQTSNTYTLVAGDDGTVIKGQVRAINSVSTSAYVTSSNQVDATATPAFQGLLDLYPNAAAAYSLRKLRAAYTGAAVRIRRSSDNAESDIGFLNNEFDSAAAQTFCGAGNGFITTHYDQSGNGINKTQTTAADQYQIVTSGVVNILGTKPSILVGNKPPMNVSGVNFRSEFFVGKVDSVVVGNYVNWGSGGGLFTSGTFSGSVGIGGFDITNAPFVSELTGRTNYRLRYWNMKTSKLFVSTNGGSITDLGTFASNLNATEIGGRSLGTDFVLNGSYQEEIFYNFDTTSTESGIKTNQNSYYAIY